MLREDFRRLRTVYRHSSAKSCTFACLPLSTALLTLLIARPVFGSDRPVLTDEQIAAAGKPATVLIKAAWHSTVIFRKGTLSTQGLDVLRKYVQAEKKRGTKPQSIAAAVLQELAQNPLKYFVPTEHHMEQPTEVDAGGSGFIVTPDGYIVTNEHVVEYSREIEEALVKRGVLTLIMKDLQQFSDALNFDMTRDMVNLFVNAELQYYHKYSQLGPRAAEITAEMAMTIPGAGTLLHPFPCDVRKSGEVTPGKDVAILKTEQHDLPTVPMGDDTKLRTGSHIVVLGYPAAADIQELGMQPGLESTLTQGDLSARKTMPGGWDALQTSAEINHGNSGGPAFNDRGEVIGIATFGPIERKGEGSVRGINFLVPSSVVYEFLNEMNVKPQEGRLSKTYKSALADFDGHHYKRALEKFQQINNLNPGFPFVQKYITDSQGEISAGHDRTMPELPYGTTGAVVAALLMLLTTVWFFTRRRAVRVRVPSPSSSASVTTSAGTATARVIDAQVERGPVALPGGTAALPARSFGSLQCTTGPLAGRRFEVSKQGLLIGRDPSKCTIVLSDDAVSKEHAWIVPLEDGVFVIDRGSVNGTFVNSVDAPKVSKVRLHHGDRIYIGKQAGTFTYYSS